jgi:hypothetical protein
MAPLFPMGLAILGLGCSVPLTVGAGDLDDSDKVPRVEDSGTTSGSGEDAGGPIDSGVTVDAGIDGGSTSDAGACVANGDSSALFSACCSRDSTQGFCRSYNWSCTTQRVCSWDGGSCSSTGHPCVGYADCCSGGCFGGTCKNGDPQALPPGPPILCVNYSDCTSENCYLGHCAQPTQNCNGGQFNSRCIKWSDCCSLECNDGFCQDSTLPTWLQATPVMDERIPIHNTSPTDDAALLLPSFNEDPAQSMMQSPAQ